VKQHHGAILHNVAGAARILAEDFGWEDEMFLSFLPLSHAYEHTGGQFCPSAWGPDLLRRGLDKLAANIEEVRPTIMVVVPRLFEVLRTRIMKGIEKQGGLAVTLMHKAVELAARRAAGKKRLTTGRWTRCWNARCGPRCARFGGRVKALVSGGAPLNPEIGLFFEAMGLTLLQGYGQTECAPVARVNRPARGPHGHGRPPCPTPRSDCA
jgi:long-chain acyl-CoA synthetase